MQIIRRKTFAEASRYPLMVDQTDPMFILHRKEPLSGILCLEDVITVRKNDYYTLHIKVSNFHDDQYVLGRARPDLMLNTINSYYDIDRNTLETVMLATDGYVGKWAYVAKEEHYRIIALWHLQYKPVKKSRASDRPHAIFMGPRDRATFKRVRERKPE
jgi:hypothetical protein